MELNLRGVIPGVILPLNQDQEVHERNLRREVRRLLGAGVDGLVVNGVASEGVLLTPAEARRVCEIVVEEAAGRVPVVSGVMAGSTRETLQLGRLLRGAGASALMVAPGSSLVVPTRQGVVELYRTLAGEVGLPLVLFNVVPQVSLPPDLCLELAEVAGAVAIKHCNENFHQLAHLLRWVDGRIAVLSGLEDLLFPSLALGAQGMMVAIAGLLPEACVEMDRAVRRGDFERARQVHERLLPVVGVVLADESYPANLKAAAQLLGRPVGPPRSPLTPPSATVKEKILRTLQEAGFLTAD